MKKLLYVALVTVILIGLTGSYIYVVKSNPVPKTVRNQVNFAIFYPKNKNTKIDKKTFQYDPSIKSLSYVVDFMGKKITFAEQSSPDAFADDPNYYPKFAEKLNNYATFETINGRVDLTRPTKINSQTGLMNSKGTLVFAKSDGEISEADWKMLFNSLVFIKPN